ncbi:MAG: IS200/IS605 family transposase [Candidatus Saganbacteria bacterium]|nr:IS200/IS605 family transposase [Candidatus Saganbacteria bacterium]
MTERFTLCSEDAVGGVNKEKMYYHYTFRTYKSKSCLFDKDFKVKLANEFRKIAENKGFELIEQSVLEDHVHLLVKQGQADSTQYVMRMFKGISARHFFQEFPSNRFEYRKLWGRGYFYRKIAESELPEVIEYIRNQISANGYDKRYSMVK